MGILVNQNQIGGASNSSHNIGDIFYTTRTDNSLNGAVECNGSQYNFSDFDSNLKSLFDEGKLPYVSISEFDSMVTNQGGCDSFGYGINELTLYPVELYQGSDYGTVFYSNVYDWDAIEPDPEENYIIHGVKVYDKDTHEELVGYYVRKDPIGSGKYYYELYNADNEFVADINSPHLSSGEPITAPLGELQATTYFKVPKKVGRVLVRTQKPTADNNYTWYNVYVDGWCEQGGYINTLVNNSDTNISFPIEMADKFFSLSLGQAFNVNYIYEQRHAVENITKRTTTGVLVRNARFGGSTSAGISLSWQVSGYAASSEYAQSTWEYQNVQVERPMVQLFNGATDEALATCTEVLADVAGLKQTTDGMIDYVIESQEPTEANGYTWYRLYKSGWVEQGGKQYITVPGNSQTVRTAISLPIEMNNANYNTQLTQEQIKGAITLAVAKRYEGATQDPSTQTTLSIISINNKDGDYTTPVNYMWQVSGMSAQGSN